MQKITCCFSGHRSQKLPWGTNENDERCLQVIGKTKNLVETAIKRGYERFISGMAIGYDMICAEVVLSLKVKYPHIKLICAIPCKGQDRYWTIQQKLRYKKILSVADETVIMSSHYNSTCIERRNHYMVDNSSLLIALFNGSKGGTFNTINYARAKNIEVQIIDY